MEETVTIYIRLLNEDIDVYRPVQAIKIDVNLYRILDKPRDGENWEFDSGMVVECQVQEFEGTGSLLATKRANI